MGRPRKSKSAAAAASAAPEDDKKFFIHAHERDTLFGLDNRSDDDADASTNVVSSTPSSRKSNRSRKLKGHDLVGTLDDLADADHVFDLDVPSDSDASDTERGHERDFVLPEEDDMGTGVKRSGWGKRRGVFYNADDTFADDEAAKMEELEAQRLRREQLKKLKEEDFLDGAFGALVGSSTSTPSTVVPAAAATHAAAAADTMEAVEQRPRSEMSKDEILELLATSSPDLLEFILEYQSKLEDLRDALSPMYALAQRMEPEGSPVRTYLQTKYFTVLGFLLNVTFYLALYAKGVPRREITKHPVVGVLVQLKRQLDAIEEVESEKPWLAEQLEPIISAIEDMDELEMDVDEYVEHVKKELERELKEEEEEEEEEEEDDEMEVSSDFGSDDEEMGPSEEALASDLDAMDIDSEDEEGAMSPLHHRPQSKAIKRKRSVTASNGDLDAAVDSDGSDLDATLASLPAKKRKRLAMHLAAITDADDDFETLKQDAKQASRRQKRTSMPPTSTAAAATSAAAQEADFDETAGDANYGEQRSAFASMMPKKSLKKIVQSVQSTSKSKKAMSADSDVAKQSRKAAQLNAHLTKEAMEEADRDADVFSDGDDSAEVGKKAKSAAAAPKGNFNEIGINMDKVDPLRPISSLVEARAKKLAIKKDKVAKKVAAREGISVDEARKQVKFAGDADDDDMNDMSGKREASYKILKNKGLTPKRKKEDRNPRVKHRRKFETKMKKLKTVKRMVTDLKGGYQGELTGIKTHLTRQVNLK